VSLHSSQYTRRPLSPGISIPGLELGQSEWQHPEMKKPWRPWNNWLHVYGSTYGAWLRGDSRGWRSRHHREHGIGDYKNPPPPGMYKKLEERSKRLMKRQRVELTVDQRRVACLLLAEALLHHGVEVVEICVGKKHYHILARFIALGARFTMDRDYRKLVGIAKTHSAREMSEAGLIGRGGVWAVRCKAKPINDRFS
jgi:hypothetical protein